MRIYTKDLNGVTKIRKERQECPNKRFDEAIDETTYSHQDCARGLMMSKRLVNREELGRLIAQTNGSISMINESNYNVRSKSGYNTYTVTATQSGWICSCPDMLVIMPSASTYMKSNFIEA
jgi:hypothetical protein